MNEAAITHYITETFENVHVVELQGSSFFFYGPLGTASNKFPFVTLVTNDDYDTFSALNRPGIFRLNIGVSKETFRSLFGTPSGSEPDIAENDSYDFTALSRIMPHPVYGKMYWVCVLNPSGETLQTVKTLLAEAYERAAQKR